MPSQSLYVNAKPSSTTKQPESPIEVLIGTTPYLIERHRFLRIPPATSPGFHIDHQARQIAIDSAILPEQQEAVVAVAVATAWRDMLGQYAADLSQTWDEFSETLDGIDDHEPDAEDFAAAFSRFARLRRLGVRFDAAFILKMDGLHKDAVNSTVAYHEDDTDSDEDYDDGFHFGFFEREALEDDDPSPSNWDAANRLHPDRNVEQRPPSPTTATAAQTIPVEGFKSIADLKRDLEIAKVYAADRRGELIADTSYGLICGEEMAHQDFSAWGASEVQRLTREITERQRAETDANKRKVSDLCETMPTGTIRKGNKVGPTAPPTNSLALSCPECGRKFRKEFRLTTHIRTWHANVGMAAKPDKFPLGRPDLIAEPPR
jgi:hypothetical protein